MYQTKKRYGFTGTREGMNESQKEKVRQMIKKDIDDGYLLEVYHGDCVGADKDFHEICRSVSILCIRIVIFPPTDNKLRAYCQGNELKPAKPYLDRNRDIVDGCDVLIGCPKSSEYEARSGTWYTIKYAEKHGKKVELVV